MWKNFLVNLKDIFRLGFQLAKAEFKLRNEGSYLGIFWYLLNPILMFASLFFIFSDRLGNHIEKYPLFLLLGIIMFNVFQSTTLEATSSIIKGYQHLIKSINFPRESLVLSIVLKNIFSHSFELLLFCVALIYFHVSLLGIFYYVLIFIPFAIFIFGFSLAISVLTVFFVDMDNIWIFAVRIIWLGTPIFYAIENQTRLFVFNLFNPLYYFITMARDLVIYNRIPETYIIFGALGFSLFFLIFGLFVFNKLKLKMAELI
ncbi:MAG: ABC transporter permease [bacterium]